MNEQRLFVLLLVATCLYAARMGGAPEKLGALAYLLATLFSVLSTLREMHRFVHLEFGVLIVDIGLFAVLLWLALHSTRWWPLFAAGFQFDDVAIHVTRTIAPETLQMAYLYGAALWSYPMILILGAATWRHRGRVARFGSDPAWVRPDGRPRRVGGKED